MVAIAIVNQRVGFDFLLETLYFYEVLTQVGTDFSLMAKLFPKRNRTELKVREENIYNFKGF